MVKWTIVMCVVTVGLSVALAHHVAQSVASDLGPSMQAVSVDSAAVRHAYDAIKPTVDSLKKQADLAEFAPNWSCGPVVCTRTEATCRFAQAKLALDHPDDPTFRDACLPRRLAYCYQIGDFCYLSLAACTAMARKDANLSSCVGVE